MNFLLHFSQYALLLAMTLSCAHRSGSGQSSAQNNNMNSALWYQTSIEFKAHSLQTFRWAQHLLELSKKDKNWTASLNPPKNFRQKPLAVIVDTDETILDNSAYDAQRILSKTLYDHESWDQWLALAKSPALPGAIDFLNHAHKLGVTVFYVTNRRCKQRETNGPTCPQKDEHIKNLKDLGVKSLKDDQMLLFDPQAKVSHSKEDRRNLIANDYRVLLIIGDDLGDFLNDRKDYKEDYQNYWGERWIMLANPKYGSWLRAVTPDFEKHLKPFELK